MRKIIISDDTLGMSTESEKFNFNFRRKIEAAKQLDKLGVSVMLGKMTTQSTDILLVKSIAGEIENVTLGVCTDFSESEIGGVWNALKEAKHPRLQIRASLSTARMEYVYHKKAADMLETVKNSISVAKSLCSDVEFIAEDATRSDYDYVCSALNAAIEAGATTVTVCDTAGAMLPGEFAAFLNSLYIHVPSLGKVTLGVSCSNAVHMADACAVSAISAGAGEIKVSAILHDCVSLRGMAYVLSTKSAALDAECDIVNTDINAPIQTLKRLGQQLDDRKSPFDNDLPTYSDETVFSEADDIAEITKGAELLGYDLDENDKTLVHNALKKVAQRKGKVTIAELDSIIAAEAMQVPATYTLENYVVTTGNAIDILAHIKLKKDEKMLDGLSIGDGPIDAAFLAIENITGHHYELDDFRIQTVSEGREAMGQTVVKLRSNGKIFSGIGTSTDIIGSGVRAYINALNKIIYEEENQ